MEIKEHIGNIELLKLNKTAFLCSRQIPADTIIKCYDWATEQRDKGKCIISGFHSRIEKDVFHFLLKGNQPIIMVLARGLKKKIESVLIEPIEKNRLLIISPFKKEIKRVNKFNSQISNELMIRLAEEVVIGYARKEGNLRKLLDKIKLSKPVHYINAS